MHHFLHHSCCASPRVVLGRQFDRPDCIGQDYTILPTTRLDNCRGARPVGKAGMTDQSIRCSRPIPMASEILTASLGVANQNDVRSGILPESIRVCDYAADVGTLRIIRASGDGANDRIDNSKCHAVGLDVTP